MNVEQLISKAAEQLVASKHAIALTGAGMSTESGIPDFRGPNGIWTKYPDAERKAYETYYRFQRDPREYWIDRMTGPQLLSGLMDALPNPGHLALTELEQMAILKCIVTQNIDNLHQKAGSKRVLDYHGNISLLRCFECDTRYDPVEYDLEQLLAENRLPPLCRRCNGVLKSDVVYFNEAIPADVAQDSQEEAGQCDLMLICGTSAVVYPFAMLPRMARQNYRKTTIIEINADRTPLTEEGHLRLSHPGKDRHDPAEDPGRGEEENFRKVSDVRVNEDDDSKAAIRTNRARKHPDDFRCSRPGAGHAG